MKTSRIRSLRLLPTVTPLEGRLLLDGNPSGTWIGQDGHDFVGPSSTLGGDGVQDIHIALAGLPTTETIAWADVAPLGGGDWQYNGGYGPWAADIIQSANSSTADLYIDPSQVETGRPFQITLRYGDGTTAAFWVTGGTASPDLRMPQDQAQVTWVGQNGHDLVGPTAAVGPDGLQDVDLGIANLSAGIGISSVNVTASGGGSWAYGLNPSGASNAELILNSGDATKADLFLQPTTDLFGQTLTATIVYNNGETDAATVTTGHDNPSLVEPSSATPAPSFATGLSAQWVGQDGQNLVGPGAARITLSGLPTGKTVVGAILSDQDNAVFVYESTPNPPFYVDPNASTLVFQPTEAGSGDLSFPPNRNENGATLTIRLIYDDGSTSETQVIAGTTDPGLRAPMPAGTSVVAYPGDDLNALANLYGTVHLSAGVYNLSEPLTLLQPVSILADPGVTLEFTQPANSAPWTAAIKIRAGHVTLSGFAVRFTGPVNWSTTVNYGGTVIGTTDNQDTGSSGLVVGTVLTNLDLQSSPIPSGQTDVQEPDLIRLTSGLDGIVSDNTLDGGTTEFIGGPWTIVNNTYIGTVPNSFAWDVFAGHSTHDVTISGNTTNPQSGSGKTWRFLVLTNSGAGDLIANNDVMGIGPRDTDTIGANAAEVILTESYGLHFEGMPSAIADNGLILQIPAPQGGAASTGDEVAILSGPDAGQYRRIDQAIDSQTYLLDTPLPAGSYAISIATGFVGETFKGNTIDDRGSSVAAALVLVGNHFGTTIEDNTFLGGDAFKITAAPTETPDIWGWSHAPFLGATIADNTIEDSLDGGTLSVEHSSAVKSNVGRVYFSGSLTDNTVIWTASFLAAHPNTTIPGIIIGDSGSIDPGELVLSSSGNFGVTPSGSKPSIDIVAGTINGTAITNQDISLPTPGPAAPANLSLVDDSGSSSVDQITNDGRLAFQPVAEASGYEYRLAGMTTYLPVSSSSGFLPAGLMQGTNTVFVRGYDANGDRGPDASITFVFDSTPPVNAPPVLTTTNVLGTIATASPAFTATGDSQDTIELLRNGAVVATLLGPGSLVDPSSLADGVYAYTLHRIDVAGNTSDSAPVVVSVELPVVVTPTPPNPTAPVTPVAQTPAITPSGTWLGQDGQDVVGMSSVRAADGIQDVDIALTGLRAGHAITFIDIEGLGSGQWQYGGTGGSWAAALAQASGSTTAHVFFEPGAVETGRPFAFTIRYDDGQQVNFWVQGGVFDPSLKMPSATPIATSVPTTQTAPSSPTAPATTIPVPLTKIQQRAARIAAQQAVVKAAKAAKLAKAAQAAAAAKALRAARALKIARSAKVVKTAAIATRAVGLSWTRVSTRKGK